MSELVSAKHDDVAPRLSFYRRYFSTPQPLYNHLLYLGLALSYWYVGYACRTVEESIHPESYEGFFYTVTTFPFWTGGVLSFRQVRLLWQYYTNVWAWVIVILSHILLLNYAPLFLKFWFALLVLGGLGLFFFLHLGILGIIVFLLSMAGRDPVLGTSAEPMVKSDTALS